MHPEMMIFIEILQKQVKSKIDINIAKNMAYTKIMVYMIGMLKSSGKEMSQKLLFFFTTIAQLHKKLG